MNPSPLQHPEHLVQKLLELGRLVRGTVTTARGKNLDLAGVSRLTSADTIYALDMHVEPVIMRFCEHLSRDIPLVLIAEGITDDQGREGKAVFPDSIEESEALIRVIIDPIDGTRGLMYDKRSAWFLAGIAPNNGPQTRLSDIAVAVQVEVPVTKQSASDLLWAVRGQGAHGIREEVRSSVFQKSHDLVMRPSQAQTIAHGFASISNFFPGTKELASRLMEQIIEATLGPDRGAGGQGIVFEDQYISTGGQFYELIVGHDRMNADLRPLFYRIRGLPPEICVHPYDVASVLIAQEAGVIITDGLGGALDGPLDVNTALSWAGFANAHLRAKVEPVMIDLLTQWLAKP